MGLNDEALMTAAIRVVRVSRQYGQHHVQALQEVSLDIAPGEFVALMGPSGCGKSTLLNMIGAIDRPTQGQVLVGDVDLATLDDAGLTRIRQAKMGYIFQFFNLLSTLTVRENVALPLELAGTLSEGERRTRVNAMLEKVGLLKRADFYPAQLSGGEMQRVAIARALVHQPAIILADEPTGNLDTENGVHILSLIQSLARENGQTVLMATHSEEAARAADRVLRMRDGRLLEAGVPG